MAMRDRRLRQNILRAEVVRAMGMGKMEPRLRGQCQLLVRKAMARIILGAVELVIERLIPRPLHHIA